MPSFHSGIVQPIRRTIGHPNSAISGFLRARYMLILARQRPYRGFRKTIVSVFHGLVMFWVIYIFAQLEISDGGMS